MLGKLQSNPMEEEARWSMVGAMDPYWGSSHCVRTLVMPLLVQARVVQKVDNAIHRLNHYPADSVVCFVNIYPLDSDLSGG